MGTVYVLNISDIQTIWKTMLLFCALQITANPPFKGTIDAESIHDNLKNVTNTKKTELLFVALFLRMLKKGGRCACIVPDGVLFGSSNAHVPAYPRRCWCLRRPEPAELITSGSMI